ncbi:MAG: phytanoyl-CoA dioxygenase family protein [Alphaproteobacteria bacterium]|nr:phytanoyl-CoA dioxygenase family protein [Alphaproteobacteria bacterium]
MAINDFIDRRCFEPAVAGGGLSAEQAAFYNDNGYLILRGRVDAATRAALAPDVEALLRDNHRSQKDIHLKSPAIDAFFRSDAVTGAIEMVNGPSELLQSFCFSKLPGERRTKHWHQDGVYWEMSDSRVAAAFVALTAGTEDNGCIHVIPGTHRLGRIYHDVERDEFGLENLVCDISSFRDSVALVVEPGDVMLVHTLTVHASFFNNTDQPRINLGFHFRGRRTKVDWLPPYRERPANGNTNPALTA